MAGRKAAAEQTRQKIEESQKPKEIEGSDLDQMLAAMKSKNSFNHHQALDKLANAVPIENRRDEVAAAAGGVA